VAWWYAIAFAVTVALCAALTPLFRAIAQQTGFVEEPDNCRKVRETVPALAGRIAVLVVSVFAVVLSDSRRNRAMPCGQSEGYRFDHSDLGF